MDVEYMFFHTQCLHAQAFRGTLKILSVWGNGAKPLSLWRNFSIGKSFHDGQDQEEGAEKVHQPTMTSKASTANVWFWMSQQHTSTEGCAPSQLATEPASGSHGHRRWLIPQIGAESYKEASGPALGRAVNMALFFPTGPGEGTPVQTSKDLHQAG